ncbi:hypothetical protein HYV81_01735 [Candidatus Woesearchaeota archaeon]|nr:hypothetical protein [Candidatus Woesearchaeota archaeon]
MEIGIGSDLSSKYRTFLYTNSKGKEGRLANERILRKLAYPDPGSQFDHKIGPMKYLFRAPTKMRVLMPIAMQLMMPGAQWFLQREGYDALMLGLDDRIIAHSAFQVRHDIRYGARALHVFSVEVDEPYRGHGLAKLMGIELVGLARSQRFPSIRFGAGGHTSMDSIIGHLAQRAPELGVRAAGNNYVDIVYPPRSDGIALAQQPL